MQEQRGGQRSAAYRKAQFWQPKIATRQTDDGVIYIEQQLELPPYPDRITDVLLEQAEKTPERTLFAERGDDGEWRRLSYADAVDGISRLGQYLLDHGLSVDAPLAILSGNSVDHALLGLAAIHVGIPYAAISPAYSLVSADFARLKDVFGAIRPGMVYADDAETFMPAIEAVAGAATHRLFSKHAPMGKQDFSHALTTQPTPYVEKAHAAVTPDTVAKFLFTSGSTGTPKAVINTHRMICANQVMVREVYTYFKEEPPVLLDWAPWHHTAGGNKLFFMTMFNGGSFYIDDGKPAPHEVLKTVRNLKEVSPTWYFNVPKGFEMLIPHLEADAQLRENFFRDLNILWYAGASMAQHTWDALERLSVETIGERIVIATGLGATETAPATLMCTWPQDKAGNVGLPCPGVTLKLVPLDGKYDARVKGPNITPGYWNAPELTQAAFDGEGFYRFGDALKFADPGNAAAGFMFDGRTAENFKLDTGTWVATGALRTAFVDHFGDLVRDAVIAGADRPYLAALVFANNDVLAKIAGVATDSSSPASLYANPKVRERFRTLLQDMAREATGSSTRIRRILLVEEPPSMDAGEQTDKGSLNQRAILASRADLVDELYTKSDRVIEI